MFSDSTVELTADGKLRVFDRLSQFQVEIQINQTTMDILGESGLNLSKLCLSNQRKHFYPIIGLTCLHIVIRQSFKQNDLEYWRALGFTGPEGSLVVAHLDDDVLNFNVENLFWVPHIVNAWYLLHLFHQTHI